MKNTVIIIIKNKLPNKILMNIISEANDFLYLMIRKLFIYINKIQEIKLSNDF